MMLPSPRVLDWLGCKLLSFALLLVSFGYRAEAEPVADFYRDRTITMVIGYSAGGGYDLYARVLARHMGRHIPGHPRLLPQNMPGAGSLKAANFIYSLAPRRRHRHCNRHPRHGDRPTPQRFEIRSDEIHLDRQYHQRNQRLRDLAHFARQDLGRYVYQGFHHGWQRHRF
jgi:hypothetical protein